MAVIWENPSMPCSQYRCDGEARPPRDGVFKDSVPFYCTTCGSLAGRLMGPIRRPPSEAPQPPPPIHSLADRP